MSLSRPTPQENIRFDTVRAVCRQCGRFVADIERTTVTTLHPNGTSATKRLPERWVRGNVPECEHMPALPGPGDPLLERAMSIANRKDHRHTIRV